MLAFTPLGPLLYAAADRATAAFPPDLRQAAASAAYAAMGAALCRVAAGVALWRRGRKEQAHGEWPADWRLPGVATVAVVCGAVLSGLLVLAAAEIAGSWWWVLATLVSSAILALLVRAAPRLLGGGGAVRSVRRPELSARLAALAASAGVPVASIGEWRVNEPASSVAMVTGTGRRRQILLAADVLRDWTDDEVVAVVAHELAHLVHGDLRRSLLLNAVVLACGCLVSELVLRGTGELLHLAGAADPRAFPLVAFSTLGVWLLATPVRHAQSRRHERRADLFALTLTRQAEAFATAVRRAGARRLVDDRPSRVTGWLFHRHPPLAERLALAERFRQQGAAGE